MSSILPQPWRQRLYHPGVVNNVVAKGRISCLQEFSEPQAAIENVQVAHCNPGAHCTTAQLESGLHEVTLSC